MESGARLLPRLRMERGVGLISRDAGFLVSAVVRSMNAPLTDHRTTTRLGGQVNDGRIELIYFAGKMAMLSDAARREIDGLTVAGCPQNSNVVARPAASPIPAPNTTSLAKW